MPSSSPGDVKIPGYPEGGDGAEPDAANTPQRAAASPARAPAQKRARSSPTTTPARASALAVLGSLTETVRAGAVRGLRAFTDSIERPRDDSSSSGSSDAGPPSPTTTTRAVTATPQGKKRRTVLTDARMRRSHADWRGAGWDYTSAMRDKNLFRTGDTGPSVFAFPDGRPVMGDGPDRAQLGLQDDTDGAPPRPGSAMSAASAPAALSTPSSRPRADDDEAQDTDGPDDRGWVITAPGLDFDPFVIPADTRGEPMVTDDAATSDGGHDARSEPFVRAVREATALLSDEAVNSPDACAALLAFQARLRAHDPYGNFAPHPAGDSAASGLRELRRTVEGLVDAQRASAEALRELASRQPAPATAASTPAWQGRGAEKADSAPPTPVTAPPQDTAAPARDGTVKRRAVRPAAAGGQDHAAVDGAKSAAAQKAAAPPPARGVGRHDPRRAVFRPMKPFGGRIPAPASAEEVRALNATSYVVRDAVNAALRDRLVAQMDETTETVQITGVNWTERGNLCMIVSEGFVAAHLLLLADVAADAAALGAGWKASRDVPVYKAVLRNVPTRRVDGTLFTEAEVLDDLRAHSVTFRSVTLADSVEQASWIATASERARKKRSTMVLCFASIEDVGRFRAMRQCLYALGCACEPGEFQPRDRERICRNCWNPLARHRERDFRCRVKCRLCGGGHAEEDHACQTCDVLARPCVHMPLKCVNCGRVHAADDSACEYRKRMRGASKSAPPMSSRAGDPGGAGAGSVAVTAGKKKKRVRVLEPHEPFPVDAHPAPAPAPDPAPSPPPTPPAPAPDTGASEPAAPGTQAPPAKKRRAEKRRQQRYVKNVAERQTDTADAPPPSPTPPPAPAGEQEGNAAGRETPADTEGGARSPITTAADELAIQDLVGASAAAPPADADTAAPDTPVAAQARRVAPPRGAAAEFDREGRRKLAARVLAGSFKFLRVSDAVAAIRRCSDDYASAVSWADEEQNSRRKPGMQGKTEASLQKLVADMTAAAAAHKPAEAADTAPAPADE